MAIQTAHPLADPRNVALLRLMKVNPRITVSDLARRISMSAPAVRERVFKLEEAGVIRGYHLELDPAALGYPIVAFVRVRPMPGQLPRIIDLANRLPQVVEGHRVAGEDCFIMKVHFEALDTLDQLLDQFLAFGQTTTSIVQSTPVPPRSLPLPDEREG